ncbi:helix-turn-helix domain-containing protein [Novacetimonas hansenii]|uniref:Helix-turn-helix domain-containing protein n=1 Tax=Novacetimonas hansenii TaxID=436 RepID=A0AAW5EWT7_NOVHA|nr:helix-turn-helix domain-containing protein [Novacetimonas hansenii]MCJ8355348.1 helix-turn-helix domain-containing protein [Novacetimonas hansenii]
MSIWAIIDEIAALLASAGERTIDRKVDRLLAALSETIADALPTANQDVLRDGAKSAKRALETLSNVEHHSTNFAAGQLAAVADILGFTADRAASDEAVVLASRPTYAILLRALEGAALSNTELSRRIGRSEEHVCRLLRELRSADLITTERRGRNAFNILTPVGRLLSENKQAEEIGTPTSMEPVLFSYQLTTLEVANDLGDGAELPRLKVAVK